MAESTTTPAEFNGEAPDLQPDAFFYHADFALELEHEGDTVVYTFIDEPQDDHSSYEEALNDSVAETARNSRNRARSSHRYAEKLGLTPALNAMGFYMVEDGTEVSFGSPTAEGIELFSEENPGVTSLSWRERNDSRQFETEDMTMALAEGALLMNSGRGRRLGVLFGFHDFVEHGIGYAFISPKLAELVQKKAESLVDEVFIAEHSSELDKIAVKMNGFIRAFDTYTVQVMEVMSKLVEDANAETVLDREDGLIAVLADVMDAEELTKEDVVVDITSHTTRMQEYSRQLEAA